MKMGKMFGLGAKAQEPPHQIFPGRMAGQRGRRRAAEPQLQFR